MKLWLLMVMAGFAMSNELKFSEEGKFAGNPILSFECGPQPKLPAGMADLRVCDWKYLVMYDSKGKKHNYLVADVIAASIKEMKALKVK